MLTTGSGLCMSSLITPPLEFYNCQLTWNGTNGVVLIIETHYKNGKKRQLGRFVQCLNKKVPLIKQLFSDR